MLIFKMKHTPYDLTVADRIAYVVLKWLGFDILYSKIMCGLGFINIMRQNITQTSLFALSVTLVNVLLGLVDKMPD